MFYVGPLTTLGSIKDGLTGDYRGQAVKRVLDGFAASAFFTPAMINETTVCRPWPSLRW